jgi:hypothetical protein
MCRTSYGESIRAPRDYWTPQTSGLLFLQRPVVMTGERRALEGEKPDAGRTVVAGAVYDSYS